MDLIFWNKENKYISNIVSIFNSTKILILTRDPISRFKTFINHGLCEKKIFYHLDDNFDTIYYIGKNGYEIPILNQIVRVYLIGCNQLKKLQQISTTIPT
ncbi:hypothetical protein GQV94_02820 [Campylobacter sp. TTU_617]|nr:hypothetical protein [Campylobacter sp. TTU_617]